MSRWKKSAASQIADELIVLDTGSKDRSVEIAGEYTDLVYNEPWEDSFARARNSVASKASCDFAMWLDADDVIDRKNIQKIIELKKQLTDIFDVIRKQLEAADFPAMDELDEVTKDTTCL